MNAWLTVILIFLFIFSVMMFIVFVANRVTNNFPSRADTCSKWYHDVDGIGGLITALKIVFLIILFPVFIASFCVKAALGSRRSGIGRLVDILDWFSIFGE